MANPSLSNVSHRIFAVLAVFALWAKPVCPACPFFCTNWCEKDIDLLFCHRYQCNPADPRDCRSKVGSTCAEECTSEETAESVKPAAKDFPFRFVILPIFAALLLAVMVYVCYRYRHFMGAWWGDDAQEEVDFPWYSTNIRRYLSREKTKKNQAARAKVLHDAAQCDTRPHDVVLAHDIEAQFAALAGTADVEELSHLDRNGEDPPSHKHYPHDQGCQDSPNDEGTEQDDFSLKLGEFWEEIGFAELVHRLQGSRESNRSGKDLHADNCTEETDFSKLGEFLEETGFVELVEGTSIKRPDAQGVDELFVSGLVAEGSVAQAAVIGASSETGTKVPNQTMMFSNRDSLRKAAEQAAEHIKVDPKLKQIAQPMQPTSSTEQSMGPRCSNHSQGRAPRTKQKSLKEPWEQDITSSMQVSNGVEFE